MKNWEKPQTINTDKAGCYLSAIEALKAEGLLPHCTKHRRVKYLNNIVESDHGKIKRLTKPALGFKSMKTAYATLKGIEAMHSLRKGQGSAFRLQKGVEGEKRLIERYFNLGKSALQESIEMIQQYLCENNTYRSAEI